MKWSEEEFMVVGAGVKESPKLKEKPVVQEDPSEHPKEVAVSKEEPEPKKDEKPRNDEKPKKDEKKNKFGLAANVISILLSLIVLGVFFYYERPAPSPLTHLTGYEWQIYRECPEHWESIVKISKGSVGELYEPNLKQISHDLYRWCRKRGEEGMRASEHHLITLQQWWWPRAKYHALVTREAVRKGFKEIFASCYQWVQNFMKRVKQRAQLRRQLRKRSKK